jgi:hypothetical protein
MLDLHPVRKREEDSVESSRARTGALVAGLVVALVVALAVVLTVVTRRDGAGKPATAPQTSASQATRPSLSASSTPSAATPLETAVPSAPPGGVTWSLFQGVALPTSPTDGPSRIEGPVYAGYSHTPTGALLAMSNLVFRYLITPGDGWRQVVEQQVVPNSGRDVFVVNRAKAVADDPPGTYGQIAGFKYVTYTPDVAVVQLVTRFSNGTMHATTDTVVWQDGDWKLQLQPDGGTSPTAESVSSLAGFIPWGGV